VVYFEELVRKHQLFIEEKLVINQTPAHQPFRVFYLIAQKEESFTETYLTIKSSNEQYTDQFKELLKDYYLQ
ncbi:MAG: hypothetical protein J7497_02230, partial [Chitinophagaceae bacterium]|nr:hypothetical protein [Chitinophagaceae bacterium]